MLHELLFSLLGFVGDIIVEENGTFKVKDGFDLLSEGERDQINRIAPLGWYYNSLGRFVQRYDVSWGGTTKPKVYMSGLVQGVSDLLQEYCSDVSYLEQLILSEGPIPLSQILQHLQKYVLVFPQLFNMLQHVEASHVYGCRLLDYFHNYNTGVPVLKDVISRIVQRLRVVFLKQLFAWMIHGELEDPGCEFFIQTKSGGSSGDREIGMGEPPPRAGLHDKVLHRLFAAKASTADQYKSSDHTTSTGGHPSSTAFDWSTSYSLSLDKIASSHVSPRIASKILFAGKAVKLLQASGSSAISSSTHNTARSSNTGLGIVESEAYRYLSSGAADVAASTAAEDESAAHIHNEDEDLSGSDSDSDCVPTAGATDTKKLATTSLPVSHTREAFKAYVETGGFTVEDTVRFTTAFSEVLAYPDQAVELLESAVEAINDAISNRLWVLLRDSFGFLSFLQVIRSTYLLGRGELFQSLLDGILTLTYAATPEPLEMDNILNWKVLRTSAKLIGLESDDSLNDMIQLRVNHADLNVKNFALHTQDLQLIGAAVEVAHVIPGSSMGVSGLNGAYISKAAGGGGVRAGQRSMVELCRPAVSSSFEQFEHIWSQFLRKKVAGRDEATMTVQSALHQEEEFEDGGEQEGYLSDLDGDSLDGTASPQHPPEAVSLPSRPSSSQVPPKSPPATKPLRYTYGILSLADQKHVTRGFNWCTTFMCGWNELRVHLTPNHACFRSPAAERQSERVPFPPPGSGARVVTLGSIACSLRGDKKAQLASNLRCSGGLVGGVGNLTAGASFHAMTMTGVSGVRYFARVFVRTGMGRGSSSTTASQLHLHHHSQLSVGSFRHSLDLSASAAEYLQDDDVLLSEQIIDIDDNLRDLGFGDIGSGRSISSSGAFQLDVEYVRSLQQQQQQDSSTCMNDLASLNSLGTDRFSFATYAGTGAGAGVMYQLRVRLSNASSGAAAPSSISPAGLKVPLASRSGGLSGRYSFGSSPYTAASSPVNRPTERWDLLEELDVSTHVKCQGGQAFVSLDAAGLLLSSAIHGSYKDRNEDKSGPAPCFFYQVHSLDFSGKGVLSTYPVASPSTFSRYPDTFARIQNEVDKVRAWMQLKLQLSFPPMFRVIFDADAVGCYERIFAAIMKVRVVAHALERLWIARSRLASDRGFCQTRHSMHFFVSNLLYYLQVDVVDSEYSTLQREIAAAADFQSVLRAHKTFTSNMLRLSLIDHTSVQEGIERILQICLRFIAVCRILHQAEFLDEDVVMHGAGSSDALPPNAPPIYVPPEEFIHIRKDFFAQVSMLFQLMRKVESRGFIFRLDFNGYLSNASLEYSERDSPSKKIVHNF